MNISVDHPDGHETVAVLRLEGDLDASNFETLIDAGATAQAAGATDILVDLRKVPFMGSSGLVALHSLALSLGGAAGDDIASGWEAQHAMARSVEGGMQPHLKVLLDADPSSALARVMDRTGMSQFIEVLTDESAAIAAF
jgi:anti-anti-sigma factor